MNENKKVALVTGSATGVGAATCLLLAENGWDVVINYSRSAEEAAQTATSCEALGSKALVVQADVANDVECRRLVDETVKMFGRIDALVNNAGTTRFCNYSDLGGLSEDDFLFLYKVNVIGAYQVDQGCSTPP